MKEYNVYIYNFIEKINDCYTVFAINPSQARKEVLERIFIETDYDLEEIEITRVIEVK